MNQKLSPRRRALSLFLALVLILGLAPVPPAMAAAAPAEASTGHWASSYLNQLVEWGFIRADQAQEDPDRDLTRADFMSIVNRAYGYHENGPTPFEDVSEYDWFYDDVGIAYNAGYIHGTSPTTASPNEELNRETAATILGRNMMLQESAGEILDFSDARDISNWARGTIKSSMEHYLVNGYDDGTFRPQQTMTWGEIAAMLTRTVGTPLQDEGEYSLGGVFGNVTVTSPGVTLRDTVISGDLYITGGVGLGGIKLENVTVLGRIIASGTGSSEGGASILMRNVTADELLVDNLQDKEVSIQADGITEIGKTTVRSSAYIEDNTPDGLGLHMISFEGDFYGEDEEPPEGWTPPQLTLAGRVEEVVNRTPDSTVEVAKGTVAKLTVDEEAVNSTVVIDRGAVVKDLVLDTGVDVTGQGDVTKLEVNAPGSIVTMLPDQIEIRPGTTAVINGQVMDSTAAEESSLEPLILSGYPQATDIAPTSITALFSTNKKGTIYWAVSAITDGSVGEDDLIKPPAYGAIAVQKGTVTSPQGNEEVSAAVTGLQPDGSYYLSAVLVDDRGQRSPVKVISFTTPDNKVPAFNQGYPYMSRTKRAVGESQAVVMANKDCVLYYVLYPQGAAAPTVNDLKAAAVSGNLGYGVQTLEKNTEFAIPLNSRTLQEQTNYVAYFWLTDANGANSSAIISLPFTTADETLPYFLAGYPRVTTTTNNSVTLTFRINENGRAFWVVRPEGDTTYPLSESGQTGTAPLDSEYAKLQVSSENPAISVNGNTDGRMVITGLEPEKAYDLYYLCQDTAGNFSLSVEKMTIRTADGKGPQVIGQYFDSFTGTDNTRDPKADTAIDLVFSENICSKGTVQMDFNSLYQEIWTASDRDRAVENLVTALKDSIVLWKKTSTGSFVQATAREFPYPSDTSSEPAWDIDYSLAVIDLDPVTGQLTVTFPDEALNLQSGGTYHFIVSDITDNAVPRKNDLIDENENVVSSVTLPDFLVSFASVILTKTPGLDDDTDGPQKRDRTTKALVWAEDPEVDETGAVTKAGVPQYVSSNTSLYFRMTVDSTDAIAARTAYDILLWNQETLGYQLYYRVLQKDNESVKGTPADYKAYGVDPLYRDDEYIDGNGWLYLGDTTCSTTSNNWQARSVSLHINGCGQNQFPRLSTLNGELVYEFIIDLTYADSSWDSSKWSGEKFFRAQVVAGISGNLYDLAGNASGRWERDVTGNPESGVAVISNMDQEADKRYLEWSREIHDSNVPKFANTYPQFLKPTSSEAQSDNSIIMRLGLDRKSCYVYYLLDEIGDESSDLPFTASVPETIEVAAVAATDENGNPILDENGNPVPKQNADGSYDLKKDSNGRVIPKDKVTDGSPIVTIRNPYAVEGAAATGGTLPLDPMKAPLSGNETPDGLPLFEVILPDIKAVVDPPQYFGANLNSKLYGEISFGNATSQDYLVSPAIDQELKPSTTYLAYFVLKGQFSEESEVYVYRFTTDATTKPRIRQMMSVAKDAEVGDLDIRTHVPASGKYRAVTDTAAEYTIDILGRDFKTFVYTPDELNSITGGASAGLATPACYREEGFTVLDALTTNYGANNTELRELADKEAYYIFPESGTGYTVFDYYANSTIRGLIYEVIQSENQTAGDKARGDYNTEEPATTDRDRWYVYTEDTKLTADQEGSYYNLVYAVNENIDLGAENTATEALMASFHAYKFRIGELERVKIEGVSIDSLEPGDAEGTYSGSISVNFEKTTHLHNSSGTVIPKTAENLLQSRPGGDTFTTFEPANPEKVTIDPNSVSGTSFTLNFKNVTLGRNTGAGVAAVYSNNYFANEDNEPAGNRLRFYLEKTRTGVTLSVSWGPDSNVIATKSLEDEDVPPDLQLTFDGLTLSGDDFLLTLDGTEKDPYERTVTGRLVGTGKIFRVSVNPVQGKSQYAYTNAPISESSILDDGQSFELKFIGIAPGENEIFTVTASVEDANGDTKPITRNIRVTVVGGATITGVTSTPNDTTATTSFEYAPEGNLKYQYQCQWDRSANVRCVTRITFQAPRENMNVETSGGGSGITVNKATVNGREITVPIVRAAGAPNGGPVTVTVKIGLEEFTFSINLTGSSDSGLITADIGQSPFR